MSYFLIVAMNDTGCANSELPIGIRLTPLANAQPYVREAFARILPSNPESRIEAAYLVEDQSGTSSDLFTEVAGDCHFNGRSDMCDTRLGRVLAMACRNNWLICAWWADSESSFAWMAQSEECLDLLWNQLRTDGNVSVGYLPAER